MPLIDLRLRIAGPRALVTNDNSGHSMFDFTSGSKRQRVQAVLTHRMNQQCLNEMSANDRGPDRSAYVHALVVVPGRKRHWQFSEAFPVLSRDISPQGMALLHNELMEGEVLVEVPGEAGPSFVRCSVQHCSSLGLGYWQIGLKALEVVNIEAKERHVLEQRIEAFAGEMADS